MEHTVSLFIKKNIVENLWKIVYSLHTIVEHRLFVEYMTNCWKITYTDETK